MHSLLNSKEKEFEKYVEFEFRISLANGLKVFEHDEVKMDAIHEFFIENLHTWNCGILLIFHPAITSDFWALFEQIISRMWKHEIFSNRDASERAAFSDELNKLCAIFMLNKSSHEIELSEF